MLLVSYSVFTKISPDCFLKLVVSVESFAECESLRSRTSNRIECCFVDASEGICMKCCVFSGCLLYFCCSLNCCFPQIKISYPLLFHYYYFRFICVRFAILLFLLLLLIYCPLIKHFKWHSF